MQGYNTCRIRFSLLLDYSYSRYLRYDQLEPRVILSLYSLSMFLKFMFKMFLSNVIKS